MKALFALFAAIAALFAAPALAANPNSHFVGPRVDVIAGVDNVNESIKFEDGTNLSYGASVGLDVPLGSRLTAGVEANADNFADYKDFGLAGRLGYAADDNLLFYGNVGYANFRGRDGLRYGGGVEVSTGKSLYGKVEYRYMPQADRHSALVGVGLRF